MADGELLDAGPAHSALDLDPRLNIVTCACGAVFGIAPRDDLDGLPTILREHRATCSRAPESTADALRAFAGWIERGGLTALSGRSRRARVELLRLAADRLDGLEVAVRDARAARHADPQARPAAQPAAAERLSGPFTSDGCLDCFGAGGYHRPWCCQLDRRPADESAELLTAGERQALHLTGELWRQLCDAAEHGPTREQDLGELIVHVHALQAAIARNVAARALPVEFRPLGGTLPEPL